MVKQAEETKSSHGPDLTFPSSFYQELLLWRRQWQNGLQDKPRILQETCLLYTSDAADE